MNFTLDNLPKYDDGSYIFDPSDGRALLKMSSDSKRLLHPNAPKKTDQQSSFFLIQTLGTICFAGYGDGIQNPETFETGLKNTAKNGAGFFSKYLKKINKHSPLGQGLKTLKLTTNNVQSLMHAAGIWSNSPQAFGNVAIQDISDLAEKNATKEINEARTGYAAVTMYSAFTPTPLIQFNTNITMLEADYDTRVITESLLAYCEEKKEKLIEHYGNEDNIPIVKAIRRNSEKKTKQANSLRIIKNSALLIGGVFGAIRGLAFQGQNSVNHLTDAMLNQEDGLTISKISLGLVAAAIFTFSAAKVAIGAFTKIENKKPKLHEMDRELNPEDIQATMTIFDKELEWITQNPKSANTNSFSQKLKA